MKKHKGGGKSNVPGNHGKKDEGAHPTHHAMNKAHGTPMGFQAEDEYGGAEHDKGLDHGDSHKHSITEMAYGGPQNHAKGYEGQGIPDETGNEKDCN